MLLLLGKHGKAERACFRAVILVHTDIGGNHSSNRKGAASDFMALGPDSVVDPVPQRRGVLADSPGEGCLPDLSEA